MNSMNPFLVGTYLFGPGDSWVWVSPPRAPEGDVVSLPGGDDALSGHGLDGRGNQNLDLS